MWLVEKSITQKPGITWIRWPLLS